MRFFDFVGVSFFGTSSRFDNNNRARKNLSLHNFTLNSIHGILILCLWLLIPQSGFTQTEVSGNVSGVWDLEHSPYHVIGRLEIPEEETLTLEPGVEMRFFQGEERYDPVVLISGSLVILGEEDNPIHILLDPDWNPNEGPTFYDLPQAPSDNPIQIEHAILRNVGFILGGVDEHRLRNIHQIGGFLTIAAHEFVDREFDITRNTFEGVGISLEGYRSLEVNNNHITGEETSSLVSNSTPIVAHHNILSARFGITADTGNLNAYSNRSPDGNGALDVAAVRFDFSIVRDNVLYSAHFTAGDEVQLIGNSTPDGFEHNGILTFAGIEQASVTNCQLNKLTEITLINCREIIIESSTLSGELDFDRTTHATFTDIEFDPILELDNSIRIDDCRRINFRNVTFHDRVRTLRVSRNDTLEFQAVCFLDRLDRSTLSFMENEVISFVGWEMPVGNPTCTFRRNNQVLFNNCNLPQARKLRSYDNILLEIRNSTFAEWSNTHHEPDLECSFVCIGNICASIECQDNPESIVYDNYFTHDELNGHETYRLTVTSTYAEIIGNTFYIPTYAYSGGIKVRSGTDEESPILNNLFIGNRGDGIGIYFDIDPLTEDYNCFWNIESPVLYDSRREGDIIIEPGDHSLVEDPNCRRPGLLDFRLRADSPCIDAGNPDSRDPDDSPSDIGAFYFDHNENQPPAITTNFEQFASRGQNFEIECRAVDEDEAPELIITGLPDWLEQVERDFEVTSVRFQGVVPDDQESFAFRLRAVDAGGLDDALTVLVEVMEHSILSREISGVLDPEDSPFFAPYWVTIPAEQQLTIPGGCELYFRKAGPEDEENYHGIYVDGELHIEGWAENPVVIGCLDEFEGLPKYQGIVLNSGATAWITGLVCREAEIGVSGMSSHNSIFVENSEFFDNRIACVQAYLPDTCLVNSNRFLFNSSGSGVWTKGGDFVRVCDNEFIHAGQASGHAIVAGSDNAIISGNRITNFEYGIAFSNAHVIEVSNNRIEAERFGIISSTGNLPDFRPVPNDSFLISNNVIIDAEMGFILREYSTPWLIGNEFVDCNIGVDLVGRTFDQRAQVDAFMFNNLASGCSLGVNIDQTSPLTGINNLIFDCDIGVNCSDLASGLSLVNNGFIDNRAALKYSSDHEYPINISNTGFFNNESFHSYRHVNDEYGILSRVNANDDSCDADFNLYNDPDLDMERFYYSGDQSVWQRAGFPDNDWLNEDGTVADIGLYGGPYAWGPPLAVPPENQTTPEQFTLDPIFPNPFNNSVNLNFQTTVPLEIMLRVFDLHGRELGSINYTKNEPGQHVINVSTAGWASGLYLMSFTGNGTIAAPMRMIKVK